MIRNLLALVALWVGLVLQASLFQVPPLNLVQPNLVLIVLMVVALTRGPRAALVLGATIGILQDVDFGQFIGINAFVDGFVAYFAANVFSQFLHRNIAITFLMTVCFTFVQEWMTYGLTRLFAITAYTWSTAMTQIVWQMIVNGVFLLLLYPLLIRVLAPKKQTYDDSESSGM